MGVSIGSNVIVGAGSVVNRDIPDNCVAVGIPCRPIKSIDAYVDAIKSGGKTQDTKGLSHKEKQKVWEKEL